MESPQNNEPQSLCVYLFCVFTKKGVGSLFLEEDLGFLWLWGGKVIKMFVYFWPIVSEQISHISTRPEDSGTVN
jgi:hypothetical protein